MERRLAAILAADVVGYSRLMGEDEEGSRNTSPTASATTSSLSMAEQIGTTVTV